MSDTPREPSSELDVDEFALTAADAEQLTAHAAVLTKSIRGGWWPADVAG